MGSAVAGVIGGKLGRSKQLAVALMGKDSGYYDYRRPLDVCSIATGCGVHGERASDVAEFRRALAMALHRNGPTVIEAIVDPRITPPTLKRRADSLARFFGMQQDPKPVFVEVPAADAGKPPD